MLPALCRHAVMALALLPLLFGCAWAETELRRPTQAEPETLDPHKTTSEDDFTIDEDLFESLLGEDVNGGIVPGAAESWEVSADGLTYTFHLRADGRWSNGDPVTAADFVFAFRRFVDPKTGAADISSIKRLANAEAINAGKEKDLTKLGAEAVDPLTLRLHLVERQATLLLLLSTPYGAPLHRASMEAAGDAWSHAGKLVGNGPYKLDSWTPQSELLLVRNPFYKSPRPAAIDRIRYLVTDDLETGVKRFLAGEMDYALLPGGKLDWAKAEHADVLHSGTQLANRFIFFNVKSGRLAKHPKLREALSLAVDREVLVDKVDRRGDPAAYSWTAPVIPGYAPPAYDWRSLPMAARLERARKLLAEEGYGPDHPLAVTLYYPTREDARRSLLAVAGMWKTGLGVEVTLSNEEWRVFIAREAQFDFDIGWIGRVQEMPDAGIFLEPFASSAAGNSDTGYANPEFDRLLTEAEGTVDATARNHLLEQAEALMLADYPVIPLSFNKINRLVSRKLKGVPDGVGYPQSRYLSFVEP